MTLETPGLETPPPYLILDWIDCGIIMQTSLRFALASYGIEVIKDFISKFKMTLRI